MNLKNFYGYFACRMAEKIMKKAAEVPSEHIGTNSSSTFTKNDGLVKSQIYVVVDLKQQFAVPHVLPNRCFRYYA